MLENNKEKLPLNSVLGIGKLLRDMRHLKGLTLAQVAKDTGIAEETVRRIECDQFEPKISTLETLSNFYRIDLIELISKRRPSDSLFSDAFISKVNRMINQQDFEGLRRFADEFLKTHKTSKHHQHVALSNFLYALKYIKFNPKNGQDDTIMVLESLLLDISPDYLSSAEGNYPLPLEVSCILVLSVVYRQNQNYDKAIALLTTTIQRILGMPYLNMRFSDYLTAAYFNLAYTYHSMNAHQKVIEVVDKCFTEERVVFNKKNMSYLLFRKGLAMFILNEPSSQALIATSLSLMTEDEQVSIKKIMQEQYGLSV